MAPQILQGKNCTLMSFNVVEGGAVEFGFLAEILLVEADPLQLLPAADMVLLVLLQSERVKSTVKGFK